MADSNKDYPGADLSPYDARRIDSLRIALNSAACNGERHMKVDKHDLMTLLHNFERLARKRLALTELKVLTELWFLAGDIASRGEDEGGGRAYFGRTSDLDDLREFVSKWRNEPELERVYAAEGKRQDAMLRAAKSD